MDFKNIMTDVYNIYIYPVIDAVLIRIQVND